MEGQTQVLVGSNFAWRTCEIRWLPIDGKISVEAQRKMEGSTRTLLAILILYLLLSCLEPQDINHEDVGALTKSMQARPDDASHTACALEILPVRLFSSIVQL